MRKSDEHSTLLNIKVRQNLEHSNFSKIQEQTVQHFRGGSTRKSVEHSSLLNIKVRHNLEHSNFSQIQEQTVQHFWGVDAQK